MSTANTRRVVVTGLGLVTPLGSGVEVTWKAILAGKSGAGNITTFDASTYACNVACEVPRVDGRGGGGPDVEGAFDPDSVMSQKDQRRIDDFILYAIAAADEAVKDSGWAPEDDEGRERTGVIIGSGPPPGQPLLHPVGPDQPGLGPGLHPSWFQGPQPLGGDRLRHGRSRGRGCGAHDQVWRR